MAAAPKPHADCASGRSGLQTRACACGRHSEVGRLPAHARKLRIGSRLPRPASCGSRCLDRLLASLEWTSQALEDLRASGPPHARPPRHRPVRRLAGLLPCRTARRRPVTMPHTTRGTACRAPASPLPLSLDTPLLSCALDLMRRPERRTLEPIGGVMRVAYLLAGMSVAGLLIGGCLPATPSVPAATLTPGVQPSPTPSLTPERPSPTPDPSIAAPCPVPPGSPAPPSLDDPGSASASVLGYLNRGGSLAGLTTQLNSAGLTSGRGDPLYALDLNADFLARPGDRGTRTRRPAGRAPGPGRRVSPGAAIRQARVCAGAVVSARPLRRRRSDHRRTAGRPPYPACQRRVDRRLVRRPAAGVGNVRSTHLLPALRGAVCLRHAAPPPAA